MARSIFESVLSDRAAELARAVGTQRVAQHSYHHRVAPADPLAGVVAGLLAPGNDLGKS